MIQRNVTIEQLNKMSKNTMMQHLDIEFTEVGEDFVRAKMPVDHRHHQPYGLLHGGASVVLAETLGSVAAHYSVKDPNKLTVGLEINANHMKSVRSGFVVGTAHPLHIGKSTQVWEIKIVNEQDELVCVSRLTMAVIERK
ncbi:hotdog fold thioesterase [Fulvivirga sp. M361]|uniref:hotdog fold thioesterase n=1 Tax=Fulvivirga sp. M361 TaxID=2594266 RepID=UPI00117AF684|nr:hotdog fold thioesterase [Fulvivirga sp. M361]TRX49486.1 hotdog fold thioesterase [Fulvivirga sp. M361]